MSPGPDGDKLIPLPRPIWTTNIMNVSATEICADLGYPRVGSPFHGRNWTYLRNRVAAWWKSFEENGGKIPYEDPDGFEAQQLGQKFCEGEQQATDLWPSNGSSDVNWPRDKEKIIALVATLICVQKNYVIKNQRRNRAKHVSQPRLSRHLSPESRTSKESEEHSSTSEEDQYSNPSDDWVYQPGTHRRSGTSTRALNGAKHRSSPPKEKLDPPAEQQPAFYDPKIAPAYINEIFINKPQATSALSIEWLEKGVKWLSNERRLVQRFMHKHDMYSTDEHSRPKNLKVLIHYLKRKTSLANCEPNLLERFLLKTMRLVCVSTKECIESGLLVVQNGKIQKTERFAEEWKNYNDNMVNEEVMQIAMPAHRRTASEAFGKDNSNEGDNRQNSGEPISLMYGVSESAVQKTKLKRTNRIKGSYSKSMKDSVDSTHGQIEAISEPEKAPAVKNKTNNSLAPTGLETSSKHEDTKESILNPENESPVLITPFRVTSPAMARRGGKHHDSKSRRHSLATASAPRSASFDYRQVFDPYSKSPHNTNHTTRVYPIPSSPRIGNSTPHEAMLADLVTLTIQDYTYDRPALGQPTAVNDTEGLNFMRCTAEGFFSWYHERSNMSQPLSSLKKLKFTFPYDSEPLRAPWFIVPGEERKFLSLKKAIWNSAISTKAAQVDLLSFDMEVTAVMEEDDEPSADQHSQSLKNI